MILWSTLIPGVVFARFLHSVSNIALESRFIEEKKSSLSHGCWKLATNARLLRLHVHNQSARRRLGRSVPSSWPGEDVDHASHTLSAICGCRWPRAEG